MSKKDFLDVLVDAVNRMGEMGYSRGEIIHRLEQMEQANKKERGVSHPAFYAVVDQLRQQLVDHNNVGIAADQRGNTARAMEIYEESVRDGFHGTHPYERLRIYYTKQKRFNDAIRICLEEIEMLKRTRRPAVDTSEKQAWLEKQVEKLEKRHREQQAKLFDEVRGKFK